MIPVLIPAAGASSRMRGTDKLMQIVDGLPLLRQQAQMARQVSDDVRIALPHGPHPRHEALDGLQVRVVEVPDPTQGLSASLRALFATLTDADSHAIVLLADLPDIEQDDLRALIAAAKQHRDAMIWRGATPDGAGGHPIMVSRQIFQEFNALQGDEGGQSIMKRHADATRLVRFADNRARNDLDTPEAWAAWRAART